MGIKTLLQSALSNIDHDLEQNNHDNNDDEEEHYERMEQSRSCAIPSAPEAIPPSASIERDLSSHRDASAEPPKPPQTTQKSTLPLRTSSVMSHRAHAESVKHDLEQALSQGYTRNLIIAIAQA